MTKNTALLLSALLFVGFAAPLEAADYSDPTWPCIQRKAEQLSPGLMWPHPIEKTVLSPEESQAINELAARLVLRRLELAETKPFLDAYVKTHGNDVALSGQVFQEAFRRISATRSEIIKGIGKYSLSQIAMSKTIDEIRTEMDTLMAAKDPDYDRIDALEEKLDWSERIYTDRAKSLTYICETPVILEKRLYAISRMLLGTAGKTLSE